MLTPEMHARIDRLRKKLERDGPVSKGHAIRVAIIAGLDAIEGRK